MNKDDLEKNIKRILAEQLGVETDEIKSEMSFNVDLQMDASGLSDFINKLEESGIDAGKVDLTEIETIQDLIEALE